MRLTKNANGWTRSNTGHHFGHYRIRVVTSRIDGGPPLYCIYDHRTHARVGNDGRVIDFKTHVPIRDLRKAKRLIEKFMRDETNKGEL